MSSSPITVLYALINNLLIIVKLVTLHRKYRMEITNTFETERLLLRPTGTQDASFIRQLLNTPKWIRYIGDRGIKTDRDAEAYIKEKMLPQFKRLGFGNFTLIRKSDELKIGVCGLYDRPGLDGMDIGFALLPEFEGAGYASEASKFVLKKAFEDFGLCEVKAITSKSNIASQNLLLKLGLKSQGFITFPNDNEELMLYAIKLND